MNHENNGFLQCLQQLDTSIYKPGEQACVPVFRALSLNARTIIQRMLYADDGRLTETLIQASIYQMQPLQVLELAIQLKIIIIKRTEEKQQTYSCTLDQNFLQSMRDVIEGRSKPILQQIGYTSQGDDELKQECQQKWKNLFDLISKRNKSLAEKYRKRVEQTLKESQLLEKNAGAGFSFILSTTQKQINYILKHYVSKQSTNVMRFILNLSVLDPKKIYSMPQEEWQKEIILDLAEFGFTTKLGSSMRITYLFWNFLYEPPSVQIGISCKMIVEANFKIYAYINSGDPQEVEILGNLLELFSEIKKRFSILIIADLSEQSIRKAYHQNLEAKQIIQFLEMNSQPMKEQVVEKQQPINGEEIKKRLDFLRIFQDNIQEKATIPHNIVQQIQFWESQFKIQ